MVKGMNLLPSGEGVGRAEIPGSVGVGQEITSSEQMGLKERRSGRMGDTSDGGQEPELTLDFLAPALRSVGVRQFLSLGRRGGCGKDINSLSEVGP